MAKGPGPRKLLRKVGQPLTRSGEGGAGHVTRKKLTLERAMIKGEGAQFEGINDYGLLVTRGGEKGGLYQSVSRKANIVNGGRSVDLGKRFYYIG